MFQKQDADILLLAMYVDTYANGDVVISFLDSVNYDEPRK